MTASSSRAGNGTSRAPTLRQERELLRQGHVLVAGMDEVGRGALAGPVSVGVTVVEAKTRSAPVGVRDSKLLTPAARESLVPALRRWAVASAVGHAAPEEIDRYGIVAALRLAGRRALMAIGLPVTVVLLDGSHDWLSTPAAPAVPASPPDLSPEDTLFEWVAPPAAVTAAPLGGVVGGDVRPQAPVICLEPEPQVFTQIKADQRCAAVAAASVLAKVERDAIMTELATRYPGYGWQGNKGYSAAEHVAGLTDLGACDQHRRSWRLPTRGPTVTGVRERR